MSELPNIAGWPSYYPKHHPKDQIKLFLDDLLELKKDPQLVHSHLWLSKFAKNSIHLEKELASFQESHDFTRYMKDLLNWIESATEHDLTFSEIIFRVKRSHYKNIKEIQKFIKSLLKDKHGLKSLITTTKKALKKAKS
jgi:hypothetical protein